MRIFKKRKVKSDRQIVVFVKSTPHRLELIAKLGLNAKVSSSKYSKQYFKLELDTLQDLNLYKVASGIKRRMIVASDGVIACENTYD